MRFLIFLRCLREYASTSFSLSFDSTSYDHMIYTSHMLSCALNYLPLLFLTKLRLQIIEFTVTPPEIFIVLPQQLKQVRPQQLKQVRPQDLLWQWKQLRSP